MRFKEFLTESYRTGAKLGLYPPISDAMGQYPPLYATPKAADFITYYDIEYPNDMGDSKGLIHYGREKPKIQKFTWANFKNTSY